LRRGNILPLPEKTGQAIVDYLGTERPQTTNRTVFVRHVAPYDMPIRPGVVRRAVREAYQRCGSMHSRVHILRHSLASMLLRQGAPLKEIDLAAVLKRKIRPAFESIGIKGVGWHTFRHTVGTLLAEMGEHQLTIRDYLRHSNLSVTNKYLQAASNTKRKAQDKLVEAISPTGITGRSVGEAVAP
jgi:integrase